ncbi:programmed cell death protein 1 [Echinops telfairi]|uniref:Programmed cell death protein 1 n=1 Tax=Echinops telfairi TaxID=9371 RepID=A0AC55DML3_ECHTE|nr:programmed cell death protein 1 [Echinops telfairi]
MLNWYRGSPNNQSVKLAAFPKDNGKSSLDPRFNITQEGGKPTFRLRISAVYRNDSGNYYCGAIHLPPQTQISESPCAQLTVTDRVSEPPTAHPSPLPGGAGHLQVLVVSVTSVLVGILLLLLLAWVLITVFPRGMQGPGGARSDDTPLKEDPLALPVPTVDYGELDFERREKTPEPPASYFPEQTEYAVIVFPDGVPPGGHRGSAEGVWGPRPLRPEDAHSSWPL